MYPDAEQRHGAEESAGRPLRIDPIGKEPKGRICQLCDITYNAAGWRDSEGKTITQYAKSAHTAAGRAKHQEFLAKRKTIEKDVISGSAGEGQKVPKTRRDSHKALREVGESTLDYKEQRFLDAEKKEGLFLRRSGTRASMAHTTNAK